MSAASRQRTVECVPNFSEGRDLDKIAQITEVISSVSGVKVLGVDPGADTNRTVVTFVGPPDAVAEAAFRGVAKAAEILDMTTHSGAHPRMGATDVLPFVPVEGITIEECADIARAVGERVGRELGIPVFLYEAAASTPARRNLATVRSGEYEGLANKLADPAWQPDFGPAVPHPRAGALITGARQFLIAYNVTLNTRDKALATDIAFEIREKGRVAREATASPVYSKGRILTYQDGRFPCGNCEFVGATVAEVSEHTASAHGYELRELLAANDVPIERLIGRKVYRAGTFRECKAIGWYVDEYDRAQISINLTDFHVTPPHLVLEEVRRLAVERGLVVTGSEIVGLIPFQALLEAGHYYLRAQGKTPGVPVIDALSTAVYSMGLGDIAPFDVTTKVLGMPSAPETALVAKTVADFVDEVSRETPAPGGGSIAALAGALAAALAAMVASLTHGRGEPELDPAMVEISVEAQRLKETLLRAVDADTDAFTAYLEARRLPTSTPALKAARVAAMDAGLKSAVEVPYQTAVQSLAAMRLADRVARQGNPNSITDGAVAIQMGYAGVRGGVWNVQINLADITDGDYVESMRGRCADLVRDAHELMEATTAFVDERLAGR